MMRLKRMIDLKILKEMDGFELSYWRRWLDWREDVVQIRTSTDQIQP